MRPHGTRRPDGWRYIRLEWIYGHPKRIDPFMGVWSLGAYGVLLRPINRTRIDADLIYWRRGRGWAYVDGSHY